MIAVCYDRQLSLPDGMSVFSRPAHTGKKTVNTSKIKYLKIPPSTSLLSFWRKVNGTPTGDYIDSWMIEPLLEAGQIPGDGVVLFFGSVYTNGLEYFVEAVQKNGDGYKKEFLSIQHAVPDGAVAGFICGNCFSSSA